MDFFADDKSDARLQFFFSRKRPRSLLRGCKAVNDKAIINAEPPTGECPFEVPLGFETIGFFKHSCVGFRSAAKIGYRAIL